jgi:hypothetical protein
VWFPAMFLGEFDICRIWNLRSLLSYIRGLVITRRCFLDEAIWESILIELVYTECRFWIKHFGKVFLYVWYLRVIIKEFGTYNS